MFILAINVIILLAFKSINSTPSWRRLYDVDNLIAEPDYRAVKLKWNYYSEHGLRAFAVKYCEISAWNSKIRCRERHLPLLSPQTSRKLSREGNLHDVALDKLVRISKGSYEASIYDLRMLTNYTFSVRAEADASGSYGMSSYPIFYGKYPHTNNRPHTSSAHSNDFHNNVVVETKSFSARTSRCLANTSDVIVNTGPYFSGKIAVEDAQDNRCSVYGNRSSAHNVYTLTIIHDVCGSKIINNSRIETMVMVHENKEILTHNSRRYLVVCNFVPETFTLTASIAVPTHLLKQKQKQTEQHFRSAHSNEFIGMSSNSNNNNTNTVSVTPKPASNSETESDINERSNDIFTFENYKHNVRDSRMLAQSNHRIMQSNPKNINDQYWNHFFSTSMFLICGLIFCVIALLWYTTPPRISDNKNDNQSVINPYITMGDTSLHKVNNNAVVSINGNPVALVSINSLGESYA